MHVAKVKRLSRTNRQTVKLSRVSVGMTEYTEQNSVLANNEISINGMESVENLLGFVLQQILLEVENLHTGCTEPVVNIDKISDTYLVELTTKVVEQPMTEIYEIKIIEKQSWNTFGYGVRGFDECQNTRNLGEGTRSFGEGTRSFGEGTRSFGEGTRSFNNQDFESKATSILGTLNGYAKKAEDILNNGLNQLQNSLNREQSDTNYTTNEFGVPCGSNGMTGLDGLGATIPTSNTNFTDNTVPAETTSAETLKEGTLGHIENMTMTSSMAETVENGFKNNTGGVNLKK